MKLKNLLLFSRSIFVVRFALAFVGFLSTAAVASYIFASKASASIESCESHLKSAQGYRKWATMYQPLVGQNASYRGAFQTYNDLAVTAAAEFQRCKSAQ